MSNTTASEPLALLRQIEEACRASSADLSYKAETTSEWSGIAFRAGSRKLLTPLGEAVEILEYPELATIPGTRPWVCGLANVRGKLMTVVDLASYLHGTPTRLTGKTRVLAIEHNDLYTGIVVDEVMGMRHFLNREYTTEEHAVEDYLRPYIRHGFKRTDEYWAVFSLFALAETPQFLQAAA